MMIRAYNNTIQRFDITLILYILQLNGGYIIDKTFYLSSRIGDGPVYVIASILLILGPVQNGSNILSMGLLAFVIELPVYLIVKKYIDFE